MVNRIWVAALGLAALLSSPALQAEDQPDEKDALLIRKAIGAIQVGHADQAIAMLDPLLERYDAMITKARMNGLAFCGTDLSQAILYSALAGQQKKTGTVFGPEVCQAYYFKAFALSEVGRKADALATLQLLTALSPMDSQYFVELGYAYRQNGQNAEAEAAYRSALGYADLAEDDTVKKSLRAAAQRGIGYMLIEKGDLDGAQQAYQASLDDDPDSAVAKSELEYIAQQRKKST